MSESKHTPELLEIFRGDFPHDCPGIDAGDLSIVVFGERLTGDLGIQGRTVAEAHANARRIVAAWNACIGISTEALEAGVVAEMVAVINALKASRSIIDTYEAKNKAVELFAKLGGAS